MPLANRKPEWLKVRLPEGPRYRSVRAAVRDGGLHTVCEEAHCPNVGECWGAGTATFLLLGGTCTRGCAFCAVERGDPAGALDAGEPNRVAAAAEAMGLEYVVLTSVTRDDLPDGGAGVFAATITALRALRPAPLVEVLVPDYLGTALEILSDSAPDVLAHNLEVVEPLTTALRHPRFSYRRSLEVLREAKSLRPGGLTKSSIMLGLGEPENALELALQDLRAVGVDLLVLGQYLQPSPAHAPVWEYVPPARFRELADHARRLGFQHVSAGPLVRTSYRAGEAYVRRALAPGPERAPR